MIYSHKPFYVTLTCADISLSLSSEVTLTQYFLFPCCCIVIGVKVSHAFPTLKGIWSFS